MSIHCLVIFFVLTDFILIASVVLADDAGEKETRKIAAQHRADDRHDKEADKSYRQKDYQHLIAALSKIAKVRSSETASAKVPEADLTSSNRAAALGLSYPENNYAPIKNVEDISSLLAAKLPFNAVPDNAPNNGLEQEKFHCQAIRDVYIPDIRENVPSYKCKFGNRMFVLSSKRFVEDRRSSLYVNIDDNTLRKLYNPAASPRIIERYIIPATLVLKPEQENYDVHG